VLLGLALLTLVGCALPGAPPPTPTPAQVPMPREPADYLPLPSAVPAAYVHDATLDRELKQPTVTGLLRQYKRGTDGLIQVGITLGDSAETAGMVYAATMNGWISQGYAFEPLIGLGEIAVVGRRAAPDSVVVYFRRGAVDGVVLWTDPGLPPTEESVLRIAREIDARAALNPTPKLP
jgi:hypothetical protein